MNRTTALIRRSGNNSEGVGAPRSLSQLRFDQ